MLFLLILLSYFSKIEVDSSDQQVFYIFVPDLSFYHEFL